MSGRLIWRSTNAKETEESYMDHAIDRRRLLLSAGTGILGASFAAIGPLRLSPAMAAGKPLRIALSNSYIGNKWRLEMENVFKAALQMEPYKSEVQGSWFNSGNDISKQTQQLSNLIAEEVDAILIDAASPTGLNGVIRQATSRGILVIAFDNLVTAPSALSVDISEADLGRTLAEWLVQKLNGRGNVIMVTGVAGTHDDSERNSAADAVWKQHPGIKIVNRYTGMWDSSTAERNTAAVLPSLPKVDGIWCQGGTDGVLKAFVAAGRTPLPFTAGECENGFRKFMIGYNGQKVDGISVGAPPYGSIVALELARRILKKQYPRKSINLPLAIVTSDTVKVGVTVFPDQPDSFFDDFTAGKGPNSIVDLCVGAPLDGTPCPGSLSVKLPVA
jgi:ribose transport system substrate-binding protein